MTMRTERFQHIIAEFCVGDKKLWEIAEDFRTEMQWGLIDDRKSSLRMLKSYAALPTGKETGEYLALDFGGTNLRVLRSCLLGNGRYEVVKKAARPLRTVNYDFTTSDASAESLFDFIARMIAEVIDDNPSQQFLLGHTFSFPSTQTNLYNARLITWTKEFATQGVEGQVVNDLLEAALERAGLANVKPVAVINDTVAVLLAAAYTHASTYVGSIYATGHNTCYFESFANQPETAMIVNMEAGGFNKLAANRFDLRYDEMTETPGTQRLEKMVSGRYMGELFCLALNEALEEEMKPFSSIDLSHIIQDKSADLRTVQAIIAERSKTELSLEDRKYIKQLAESIVTRSAHLTAATFAGAIWHIAGRKREAQHIAVDGSVYEKMPLVKDEIETVLNELCPASDGLVDTILENGGSGLGAAIAAAVAV